MNSILGFAPILLTAAFLFGSPTVQAQSSGPVSSVPDDIPLHLTETPVKGDFSLVSEGRAAGLYVAPEDFQVVRIAADCLAVDVERVTKVKPSVTSDPRHLPKRIVLIGTLGKSELIDELVHSGKLAIRSIAGQWESFVIATVANPLPNVDEALVIAGSDRRGTAYGVFTLSEAIGVSPWVWWADVAPERRTTLAIAATTVTSLPPAVKYRGIFINDEDWGLQPWAAKTFDPETGDIGPKTYAKVCELLLRLKANYLWPAMHPCTKAFNLYSQNKLVADDYGIVMGSSHCEQMLRNNITEYDEKKLGPWNYEKNRDNILAYWKGPLEENGRFENIYTIGMRGIHDSGMPGGGTTVEKVARLQRVIDDQRALIANTLGRDPATVPQILCPYKEVLELYENGLNVPDDVTLVWPDDNHGYVRQLPNAAEQKRRGGSGVYYHLSYWGDPEDYLWLCTTPPALIWEEMHKAYEQGARDVWVVNVGDIKPGELGMEFFLRMAWDLRPWDQNAQKTFLTDWAARNFGCTHAHEIAGIMDEYYRLNGPVKPEHLLRAKFNDSEIGPRLERFASLVKNTNSLSEKLPREKQDAFYELVVYPVRCSALMNEKQLGASFEQRQKAYDQIQVETKNFNEGIAGGKWRGIMSANPRNRPVFQKPKPDSKPVAQATPAEKASTAALDTPISIEAEQPTRKTDAIAAKWTVIPGLGRTGDAIALRPTTGDVSGAVLEYDFTASKAGPVNVLVSCIPTHALSPGLKQRYAVGIDGDATLIVDIDAREFSREWSVNVLRAAAIGTSRHTLAEAGRHTIKLRALDPGMVFDQIVIAPGDSKPAQSGPRIVLVGDSTVASGSGWGDAFARLLTSGVECLNVGRPGRSSKSYRDEGHWRKALEARPTWVLIQFGHNDQPGKGPALETDARTTFRENLIRYIAEARQVGAQPMLVTSLTRRNFNAQGKIEPGHLEPMADSQGKSMPDFLEAYVEATRAVAAEQHVPLIDLNARSVELMNQLGPQAATAFDAKTKNPSIPDKTHLSDKGAEEIAKLVAGEIRQNVPELAALLRSTASAAGLRPQSPILPDFYADPSARVFGGKLYVYCSHDAAGARNWKGMVDWHVFSTEDMVKWTDHGVAFGLKDISWANTEAWAPDCIERNGKYYFYFPAGGQIGVAVSDSPTGPFKDALGRPLIKSQEVGIRYMIDPCVFIDDDGQAYLYVGGAGQLGVVKLKEDMITRDGPLRRVDMPKFYEGVWVHRRNGLYYASYPTRPPGHQANVMVYSTAQSPLGPFEYKGEILDNHSLNIHGSITEFKGRSYLFYHVEGPSHWERRVCVAPLSYNADGTIQPISSANLQP